MSEFVLQQTVADWIVLALTEKAGAYCFRTPDKVKAKKKFDEIKAKGGYYTLAFYSPDGMLQHKERL